MSNFGHKLHCQFFIVRHKCDKDCSLFVKCFKLLSILDNNAHKPQCKIVYIFYCKAIRAYAVYHLLIVNTYLPTPRMTMAIQVNCKNFMYMTYVRLWPRAICNLIIVRHTPITVLNHSVNFLNFFLCSTYAIN